jgi:hypothetical protein
MATKPQSDAMRPKLSQYLQAAVPTDDPLYLPMNLQATSLDSAQLARRYFRFISRCKGGSDWRFLRQTSLHWGGRNFCWLSLFSTQTPPYAD